MLCYTGRGCLTSKSPTSGCFQQEESLEFDIRSFNRLRYLDQTSALFSLAEQRAGNTTLGRTPPLLSKVRYPKTKPNWACFFIYDRTRFRGSKYFVLACNHTMDRIAFCRKVYFGLFFQSCIFEDILREVVVSLSKAVGKYLLRWELRRGFVENIKGAPHRSWVFAAELGDGTLHSHHGIDWVS